METIQKELEQSDTFGALWEVTIPLQILEMLVHVEDPGESNLLTGVSHAKQRL